MGRTLAGIVVAIAFVAITTGVVLALNYEGEDFCQDTPAWPNGTYLGQMHPYHSDFYRGYAERRGWNPCTTWAQDQRNSAIRGLRELGYIVVEPLVVPPVGPVEGTTPTPEPPAAEEPNWAYTEEYDEITGKTISTALHRTLANVNNPLGGREVYVQCDPRDATPFVVFVYFYGQSVFISGNLQGTTLVNYRVDEDAPVETRWPVTGDRNGVYFDGSRGMSFANRLIDASVLRFRATSWHDGAVYEAHLEFEGEGHPSHPIRSVLAACGV